MDWSDQIKVWELYYLEKTPIDRIRKKVKPGGEVAPSWNTVRGIIDDFLLLTPAQVGQLPNALQVRWGELQPTRPGKGQEALGEDLLSTAKELESQLCLPAPETVHINDFGGPGHHIIRLRQDIFKVVSKIGYNTGEFWVSKEDWHPSGEISADLEINYIVSPLGTLELFCPVEENPLFQKLLSKSAQEEFSTWKKEGGRYLTMCRDIYSEIHAEAKKYTFPSSLTPHFGDLIYLLAILHRRSPSRFPIPDRELYQIRSRSLFVSELYLGSIHLASAPEPPPFPPPPFKILDTPADRHQDMITKWSASPSMTDLLELFESLHGIVEAIKEELDDRIIQPK